MQCLKFFETLLYAKYYAKHVIATLPRYSYLSPHLHITSSESFLNSPHCASHEGGTRQPQDVTISKEVAFQGHSQRFLSLSSSGEISSTPSSVVSN